MFLKVNEHNNKFYVIDKTPQCQQSLRNTSVSIVSCRFVIVIK